MGSPEIHAQILALPLADLWQVPASLGLFVEAGGENFQSVSFLTFCGFMKCSMLKNHGLHAAG